MSDCGSLLSSYINLCPLTPNSKTHASIRMAPRSPCPLVTEQAKVKRRAAEWRWDCGTEICLWCTLHIFFLFMPTHGQWRPSIFIRRAEADLQLTLREVASITQKQDNVLSAVWQHWEVFWSLRGDEWWQYHTWTETQWSYLTRTTLSMSLCCPTFVSEEIFVPVKRIGHRVLGIWNILNII